MVFRDRHIPHGPLLRWTVAFREGGYLCVQASGKLFLLLLLLQCLVLSHQEDIPNILQHVLHFSTTRIYPQIQMPTAPPRGNIYRTILCSHTAVFEEQQAKWYIPGAQPSTAGNWH